MISANRASYSPLLVIMGVAGSGKTTLGTALSQRLGTSFADADSFHNAANIAKMSAGIALDDDDRQPWLRALSEWLAGRVTTGGVLCCSALKHAYRNVLREASPTLTFVHLNPDLEVVRRRMAARPAHFMPVSLIDSQFDALEPLAANENGITLSIDVPIDELVASCLTAVLPVGEGTDTPVRT